MKKILPYILILIVLIGAGFFGSAEKAQAQYCWKEGAIVNVVYDNPTECANGGGVWQAPGTPTPAPPAGPAPGGPTPPGGPGASALQKAIGSCSLVNIDGCILHVAYFLFGTIPAFLLTVAASFFNIIVALTLGNALYSGDKAIFIGKAWTVVRDLSNLFFILILLYIAIKTILGLGGHEVKKMVVHVIIMALLINFSMFFTKIVIDSSNILALIFYDKLTVETVEVDGALSDKNNYIPALNPLRTGLQDKDITGAIMSAFDPSKLLTDQFFIDAKTRTTGLSVGATATWTAAGAFAGSFIPLPIIGTAAGATGGYIISRVVGMWVTNDAISLPMMLGIIIITGLIMYFAMYTFFVAGLSFLGRTLELWILIVFSPFAFMSSTIPLLDHIEYIGWDAWLKRLLQVSFLAPIFMFFMYFIFLLVESNIFVSLTDRSFKDQGTLEAIVLVLIPALFILILLKKATDYAQKASGVVGEFLMKGAGIATGLAIGGGLGVVAAGLQGNLGKRAYDWSQDADNKKWASKSLVGRKAMQLAQWGGQSSYDVRKGVIGGGLGVLSRATGLEFGEKSHILVKKDGGYAEDRRREVEKQLKEAELLKVGEDELLTKILHELQLSHQELLKNRTVSTNPVTGAREEKEENSYRLEKIKKELGPAQEAAKEAAVDASRDPDNEAKRMIADEAKDKVDDLKAERSAIKNARIIINSEGEVVDESRNTIDSNGTFGKISEDAIKDAKKSEDKAREREAAAKTTVTYAETARATAVAKAENENLEKIEKAKENVEAANDNLTGARAAAVVATEKAKADVGAATAAAEIAKNTALANFEAAKLAAAKAAEELAIENQRTPVSLDKVDIRKREEVRAEVARTIEEVTKAEININTTETVNKQKIAEAEANIGKTETANIQAIAKAQTAVDRAKDAKKKAEDKKDSDVKAANKNTDKEVVKAQRAHDKAKQKVTNAERVSSLIKENADKYGIGGKSINGLEDDEIPEAEDNIDRENKNRKWARANSLEGSFFPFGAINYGLSLKESKESIHKIRMGAKSSSGTGGKGGEEGH